MGEGSNRTKIKITEKAHKEHCNQEEIEITGSDFSRKETSLLC